MDVRTIMCCAGIFCLALQGAADVQRDSIKVSDLEEVVVTGAKSGIKRGNTTELTAVLDSIDLKVLNAAKIEDILKAVPGIAIDRSMGGNYASINGLPSQYTKVLINGIPVPDGDKTGGLNLESIPISDIERIEIVKGATSALYGSDAMGGVVNIITQKNRGSRTSSLELHQQYTTNVTSSQWEKPGFSETEPRDGEFNHWGGILNGSASVSHNNDLFGIRFDAGYYHDAGAVDTIAKRPVSIFDPRPYYYVPREHKNNLKLVINTDKAIIDALTATFAFADESMESSSSDNQKLTLSTQRLDANFTVRHDFTSNVSLYAWASGQQHYDDRTRYNYDSRMTMEREEMTFPTAEAEATATIKSGESHAVTVGVNGGYEAAETDFIQGGRQSAYQLALFSQDVINIGGSDRINLTPGARFTWNSRYGKILSPSIGARFNIVPELYIRVAGGSGFKSPDFKQMYRDDWVHTGGIFVLSGNTELKAERGWSINGGFGGTISDVLQWEAGAHGARISDMIITRQTSSDTGTTGRGQHYDAVRQYVNADSAFTRGFDISLHYTPSSSLRIKAAYSFLDSRYWDDLGILTKKELFSQHTIKTTVHYQPLISGRYKPSFMGDIAWQSSQKYLSQSDGELAAFADINIAVDLPVLSFGSITIGVKNLLDNDLEEWNQATGRRIFTELTFSIYDITKPFTIQ